jgi:hypothetical protein
MAAAEAKVAAGMKAIDAQEAELRVKNDKAIAAVEDLRDRERRALADLDKARAASNRQDERNAAARLRRAQQGIAQWQRDNADLNTKLAKLAERRANLEIAAERRVLAARQKVAKETDKLHREAERGATKAAAATDKQAAALDRETSKAEQLTAQYVRLEKQRQRMMRRRDKITTSRSEKETIDFDSRAVEEKMIALRARLQAIGRDPVTIHVDIDEDNDSLSKFARTISETSVRMGPFTTTIGNAFRIMATGGPIIMGVVAALGSLVAVAGGAIVGAIGALGAGFAGLVPLIAGTAFAIAPLVGNFKKATDAAQKLRDAQIKYGKGSDQAQKAQDELKQTLKGIDPAARDAAKGLVGLKERWKDLTRSTARESFGRVIGKSFSAAQKLMPMFARQTNQFMDTASKGIGSMMDRLASPGGQKGLNTIFTNMNLALKPLMSGLESLGAVGGRVLASFSNYLPGVSHGFADWAKNLDKLATNDAIESFVKTSMNSLSSFWGLLKSVGRVLTNFFKAALKGPRGSAPALKFVDQMTSGLNDMADSMNTVEGQEGIRDFFTDFNDIATKSYQALKPFVQLMYEWSTIMRPLVGPALQFVGLLAKMVHFLTDLAPVRVALQGAFGLFLAGTLASKVLGVVRLFRQLRTAIVELGAAGAGLKALNFLTGGGLPIPVPGGRFGRGKVPSTVGKTLSREVIDFAAVGAGGAAAERTAVKMAKGTAAATGFRAALTRLGSGFLKFGKGVGPAGVALTAFTILASRHSKAADDYNEALMDGVHANKRLKETQDGLNGGYNSLARATMNAKTAHREYASASKEVRRLEAQGKKGTLEYQSALMRLNDATQQNNKAQRQREKVGKAVNDLEESFKDTADDQSQSVKEQIKAQNVLIERGKKNGDSMAMQASRYAQLGKLMGQYLGKVAEEAQANDQAALNTANHVRALQGMGRMSQKAAADMGDLTRKLGAKKTIKIATQFAVPKDAARVTSMAAQAAKAGVKDKVIMRIVANSDSAEEAVARLRAKLLTLTAGKHDLQIGAVDKASRTIKTIFGWITKLPKKHDTDVNAHDKAKPTISGVVRAILGIPSKHDTRIQAIDNALGLIHSITNAINSIPTSKTSTVTVNYRQTGHVPGIAGNTGTPQMGGGPFFASGGTLPTRDRIERDGIRAFQSAIKKSAVPKAGSKVNAPRLVVGEQRTHPEYVIATNPAYRDRNKGLIRKAANDLGMDPLDFAAKGREPQHGRPKKPKGWTKTKGWYDPTPWKGKTPDRKTWWLPPRWGMLPSTGQIFKKGWVVSANGRMVPIEHHQAPNDRKSITRKRAGVGAVDPTVSGEVISTFNSLTKQIKGFKERLREIKQDEPKKPTRKKGEKDKDWKARHDKWETKHKTWQRGRHRTRRDKRQAETKRDHLAKKYNLSQLNEGVVNTMASLQDQADAASNDMQKAGLKGNVKGFYDARERRVNLLTTLAGMLRRAQKKAKEPYKSELIRRLHDATNSISETKNEAYPGGADPLSLLTPQQADQLRKIQADVNLEEAGQADMYQASWKDLLPGDETPTAPEALVSFWKQRLAEAKTRGDSPDIIGAIAAELASAQGTGGESAAAAQTITPGQMLNNERMNLLREFGSNTYDMGIGAAGGATPGGGGPTANAARLADPYSGNDVMTTIAGGTSAAAALGAAAATGGVVYSGGGPGGARIQNVYVQPTYATVPPDPHTYSRQVAYEIGSAL